jgi:hypothetical protein
METTTMRRASRLLLVSLSALLFMTGSAVTASADSFTLTLTPALGPSGNPTHCFEHVDAYVGIWITLNQVKILSLDDMTFPGGYAWDHSLCDNGNLADGTSYEFTYTPPKSPPAPPFVPERYALVGYGLDYADWDDHLFVPAPSLSGSWSDNFPTPSDSESRLISFFEGSGNYEDLEMFFQDYVGAGMTSSSPFANNIPGASLNLYEFSGEATQIGTAQLDLGIKSVPEPCSLLLLAAGIGSIVLASWRRRE